MSTLRYNDLDWQTLTTIMNGRRIRKLGNNTYCTFRDTHYEVTLHGVVVARLYDGRVYLYTHGYTTPTTKSRLNWFRNVEVVQRDYQWYVNGKPWQEGMVVEQ